MDLTKSLPARLRPGGRHGLAGTEVRDPIGYAVAALGKLAQSDLLDRVGLRKQAEQAVYTATPAPTVPSPGPAAASSPGSGCPAPRRRASST